MKSYYRVMLGKHSRYTDESFAANCNAAIYGQKQAAPTVFNQDFTEVFKSHES
jgi:hypothetical protein